MSTTPAPEASAAPPPAGWSIFAVTLEAILQVEKHSSTPLSLLDNLRERPEDILYPTDPRSPYELVHRERLRRLLQSRKEPGAYPTLNRDDMLRIRRYFRLARDERFQLDAALVTTSIERTIKERLDDGSGKSASRDAAIRAHPIALRLYPLILAELRQTTEHGDTQFEADYRGQGERSMPDAEDANTEAALDRALEPALDAIDRATLALSLSYQPASHAERLERARAAEYAFSDALSVLDEIADHDQHAIRASEPWRAWQAEARRGLAEAQERLEDLGG